MTERDRNWGATNPYESEGFRDLRDREQNAVRVALEGISSKQRHGIKPRPMRVAITPDRPFDLKAFANVMHALGVGLADLAQDAEAGVVTFQPTPYTETRQESAKKSVDPIEAFLREYPWARNFL